MCIYNDQPRLTLKRELTCQVLVASVTHTTLRRSALTLCGLGLLLVNRFFVPPIIEFQIPFFVET